MSVFGFLVRWGSMGLGVLLLVGGVQTLISYTPRDERPRPASPAEALALASSSTDSYVTLDASLDTASVLYESAVHTPRFIKANPSQIREYALGKDGPAEDLIGTVVRVRRHLDQARIECQIVLEGSDGQTLQSMRVLAPVAGTDAMVWVVSPRVGSDEEADAWQEQPTFQGAVSRFNDLSTNVSELGYSATELRTYARDNMGLDIPPGATLVIDGQGRPGGQGPVWYAPVEGTAGNLLVRRRGDLAAPGPFVGLIDASANNADLAAAIGADPDALVVLDALRTAASENARDVMAIQVGLIGGAVFFGFGASTTWLKHALKKRRRERALAAAAALSPAHAMALGIPMPGGRSGHGPNPYQPAAAAPAAYAIPSRHTPSMQPPATTSNSGEDAALEAEMARWTSGAMGPSDQPTRRVA
jgi:hypothetical protein